MLQLQIKAVKRETAQAATFYLKEASGKAIHYQAGQFITLVINHHDEEIRRSYSLSSAPYEDMLAITVKRVANGEISRYLLTYAQPGDVWTVVEPAGRFLLPAHPQDKTLLYFAAGGGIPPVYAHIKQLLHQQAACNLILFYSNIDSNDIIFKTELDKLAANHPQQLKVIYLLSSEANRLHNQMVERLVKQHAGNRLKQTEFYLCGPFTYMRMVQLTLLYMGVEADHIHKENFVLETVPVITSRTSFPPQHLRIRFAGEWHDLVQGENQTILQAALQNQLPLPYSCGSGVCAACAVKCKEGKVIMAKNEVLTDDEMKQGWVLTCTGYAVTDGVELDFEY